LNLLRFYRFYISLVIFSSVGNRIDEKYPFFVSE